MAQTQQSDPDVRADLEQLPALDPVDLDLEGASVADLVLYEEASRRAGRGPACSTGFLITADIRDAESGPTSTRIASLLALL